MIISNLFIRNKTPQPRFAPAMFLILILLFSLIGQTKPVVGLTGLGTTLIVTAVLIEINRKRIWKSYCKSYRKQKGLAGMWTKPYSVYYMINVAGLWPIVIVLGGLCLVAAYALS